jgi:hypothetical protein
MVVFILLRLSQRRPRSRQEGTESDKFLNNRKGEKAMTYCSKLVYAAVLTLGLCGLVAADGKPAAENPTPANGTVTDEQLGQMLAGMGYEAKPGTYSGGERYFDISVPSKDFTFNIRLGLSPNKRCIWLMVYLGDVPANVTAEQLQAVLRAVNSRTGKMQFRMTGSQLKADQPLDNVAVTPARLKREIDDFVASLTDTADVWVFKKPAGS